MQLFMSHSIVLQLSVNNCNALQNINTFFFLNKILSSYIRDLSHYNNANQIQNIMSLDKH